MSDNPRKDPFRVRRGSTKEFSRVSAMMMSRIESLEARVAVLENERAIKPRDRPKKKEKPSQNDNQERFEAESDKKRLEEKKEKS